MATDVPQADRLDLVRATVDAIGAGYVSAARIAAAKQLTIRYTNYCLHAARLLELVLLNGAEYSLTTLGEQLSCSEPGTSNERTILRTALSMSPCLSWSEALLTGDFAPPRTKIAEAIIARHGGALSTALRRGGTLLAWRAYIMATGETRQLQLIWDTGPEGEDEIGVPTVALGDATGEQSPMPESGDELTKSAKSESEGESESDIGILPENLDHAAAVLRVPELPPASSAEPPVTESTLDANLLGYLSRQTSLGNLVLFTGAGFSLGASDHQGQLLPTGPAFARELWQLCYPGESYDGSNLQDVFAAAQRKRLRELDELLRRRFVVDSESLPDWYRTWFAFPWALSYSLNVDDLPEAARRRFDPPRPPVTRSALRNDRPVATNDLEVIQLNGTADDGASGVTFSPTQYSERLARQEPAYARLAADLLTRPFIFVGSPLEEPLLWQHIALRGMRARDSPSEVRPKSFLIAPELARARADQLQSFNVVWIRATAEEFALELARLRAEIPKGFDCLGQNSSALAGGVGINNVAQLIKRDYPRTEFLLGEEPSWKDILDGRAIERTQDSEIAGTVRALLKTEERAHNMPAFHAVTGTAGSGKTTLLMKIAAALHADAQRVAWVGAESDASPRDLERIDRQDSPPSVVIIDDAGRYGGRLVPTLLDLAKSDEIRLVVLGLRSHRLRLLEDPISRPLRLSTTALGLLTDSDIALLIQALDREGRLGSLRGLDKAAQFDAFRSSADRQILVALIEATSGRRFEEKIVSEWNEQEPLDRYLYALVALASTLSYPMRRDEILLACKGGGNKELDSLTKLQRARLLVLDSSERYRLRHKVIAERLIDEITSRGTQIRNLIEGLALAIALQMRQDEPTSSRRKRVLTRLLNHNYLLRVLDELDDARLVYANLQPSLQNDHHFWLQRGCLELEGGNITYARNFLDQARALNGGDPFVETAYSHMQLREAITNVTAPDSAERVAEALERLRVLILKQQWKDSYPSHVFGSQVLGWCRRANIVPKARMKLLREAHEIVEQSLKAHKGRAELVQLEYDLRREMLTPH